MSAVVKQVDALPAARPESATILELIGRMSSDQSVDVAKVEKLVDLYMRVTANTARQEYAAALADMQPQLPLIAERGGIKDRNDNVQSRYALWEDIVSAITPILSEHGFALSFRTQNEANMVSVTGVLSHRAGHSEQTTLALPIDTSGSKNAVQSVGSSTSYGKRYTAGALLNLRTGDIDDDGASGGKPTLSEEQVANLDALLSEIGGDAKARYLRYAKVKSLDQILACNYADAVKVIEKRRAAP